MASLRAAVSDLAECIQVAQEVSNDANEPATESVRKVKDELDDEKQNNLRGKFMITSSTAFGKECLIKSDDILKAEKKDLVDHVIELAVRKYGVTIPKTDVSSCTRLHKGGIILSIWNKKPGSAYDELCQAIKSKPKVEDNIFFNFMLTKRRSALLYEVRQMKKLNKIQKFYSDEKGSISIKIGNSKEIIASIVDDKTGKCENSDIGRT